MWTGEADPAWAHPGGRFGGYTAAVLLRAAMLEPNGDRPERGDPLTLTVLYTDAVRDGAMAISTRLLRSGSRLQFWRAELDQDDKVRAHAQVTFGVKRETVAFADARMPDVPSPEDEALKAYSPPTPFGGQLEARWATPGPWVEPPGGPALSLFWSRSAKGFALDHCFMAALADFGPTRVWYRRKTLSPSSTVSMSVYFHARPDEIAAVGQDFVLNEITCRRAEGGYFDQQTNLWSRSGVLLATSEQVAAFRD